MPFQPAQRVASFGTTIFAEMTQLAIQHNAINLSQGFPDFDGAAEVKAAAIAAINDGKNQYAISNGQPDLRKAIAAHAKRFYNQEANPETEITVVSGATEGLFSSIIGILNPGDEAIIIEPFYDSYAPDVIMAGGVPRYVPLRAPDWHLDPDELTRAFNNKTKLIIVNTPHNPTGKVFSQSELQLIADLCIKWNVIAISDEVYEHILFDDTKHIRVAQLDGMRERTITISSHGKSFSFTGWKIGWCIAPPDLTTAIRRAHQFVTFASGTPFQHAAVNALSLDDEYYAALIHDYQTKRDFLASALSNAGLDVSIPKGTYFIMAGIQPLGFNDDVTFCRYLTKEIGVAAIPPSAFYSDDHKALGKSYARFAFCKKMETLEKAAERLSAISHQRSAR
ncbi:MAG: aminotransferase class I/II-fold pyridoxal phosphate-dependent enzyme [Chloroflexi bacterium]|nr:aminotransferase class I/II-fold pyridoxal phosphate-dependent enzyme [Chloroflexota bacterium]